MSQPMKRGGHQTAPVDASNEWLGLTDDLTGPPLLKCAQAA
jgi:hypothetical protein